MNRRFKAGRMVMFAAFGITAILVFGWIVMSLWNAILPGVIHVSGITYFQALGILILSKILFGGFRGGGGGWRGASSRRWREKMQEKMSKMSPEEREKFRQYFRGNCGPWKGSDFAEENRKDNAGDPGQ